MDTLTEAQKDLLRLLRQVEALVRSGKLIRARHEIIAGPVITSTRLEMEYQDASAGRQA